MPDIVDEDDRAEYFAITDEMIKQSCEGVVAIFMEDKLNDHGNGAYSPIDHYTAVECEGYRRPLCSTEKYYGQPNGAILSGVLVAEDIVATTNHYLPGDDDINRVFFVFDFRLTKAQQQVIIPIENVFRGKCVIKRSVGTVDFALIRLERKASANRVRKITSELGSLNGHSAYVLGHPCGLPLKYGGTAALRKTDKPEIFLADFDTYNGNSGSPIFDCVSHKVVGIVVRDKVKDFKPNGNNTCCKSRVEASSLVSGDECLKSSLFAGFITSNCP